MAPKLSTDIQKKLLCFNSDLPRESMEVWVTMEEMRERLIHIGMNCVQRDRGISFCRPSLLNHECGPTNKPGSP